MPGSDASLSIILDRIVRWSDVASGLGPNGTLISIALADLAQAPDTLRLELAAAAARFAAGACTGEAKQIADALATELAITAWKKRRDEGAGPRDAEPHVV